MSEGASLSCLLPAPTQAEAREAGIDLEAALRGLWEGGRAAWPAIALSPPVFVAHLARHAPAEGEAVRWLSGLKAADLYLACGCALGLPPALAAFDETILSQVPRFVSRINSAPAFADEIRQLVRERLLCAAPGAAPRIVEYAGNGPLASFVRVTAVRTALNTLPDQAKQAQGTLDSVAANAIPGGQDPELRYLRTRYQAEFQAALRDAFAALSANQRTVLRMRFAMGLTIEEAAGALKVNRATVVRWQRAAEEAMLKETQRLLRERLHVKGEELNSLIRFVRSQFQMSLTDVLGQTGGS